MGQQGRMHDRWVSRRFLAERFRSAQFLALVGMQTKWAGDTGSTYLGRSSEEWLHRAFFAVWNERPLPSINEGDVPVLRDFLAEAWIDDQRAFYARAGKRSGTRHLWLGRTIGVLFAPMVITLVLNSAKIIQSRSYDPFNWSNIVVITSTSLAALGAALTGIRAHREYQSTARRFSQLEQYLQGLKERMVKAKNLTAVRRVAAEVEQVMLEENRDWFLVMRFHGFEL